MKRNNPRPVRGSETHVGLLSRKRKEGRTVAGHLRNSLHPRRTRKPFYLDLGFPPGSRTGKGQWRFSRFKGETWGDSLWGRGRGKREWSRAFWGGKHLALEQVCLGSDRVVASPTNKKDMQTTAEEKKKADKRQHPPNQRKLRKYRKNLKESK